MLIPIGHMRPGEIGEIQDLTGGTEEIRRLEELGLRRGITVQMVRAGRPCIVRLGDTKVCLRECKETQVLVSLGGAS